MNLFILRHGIAIDSTQGLKDYDRKLSEDGILQAIKIADYLKEKHIEQIICSSAPRAFETATIIDQLIKVNDFQDYRRLYLTDSETIIDYINDKGSGENILFVGHNFGISDFASDICGQSINMSTCMLVEVEMQVDNWNLLANHTGILKTITEPNHL